MHAYLLNNESKGGIIWLMIGSDQIIGKSQLQSTLHASPLSFLTFCLVRDRERQTLMSVLECLCLNGRRQCAFHLNDEM